VIVHAVTSNSTLPLLMANSLLSLAAASEGHSAADSDSTNSEREGFTPSRHLHGPK
jgi:hypothetical protein